jgi:hypothetical protein
MTRMLKNQFTNTRLLKEFYRKKKKKGKLGRGNEKQFGLVPMLRLAEFLDSRVHAAGSRVHPVFFLSTWTEMEVLGL